jgi:hypothetical protein
MQLGNVEAMSAPQALRDGSWNLDASLPLANINDPLLIQLIDASNGIPGSLNNGSYASGRAGTGADQPFLLGTSFGCCLWLSCFYLSAFL